MITMKKLPTDLTKHTYRRLKSSGEYKVLNEIGTTLDAQVFINQKTRMGEPTKELFIYFKDTPNRFVVVVAIPPKLIGIPERYNTMKLEKDILYIQKESLQFTPVNVGIEKMIDKYTISDTLITFETFRCLSVLGKKIIIKKG
jgi:hypothetical protein